MFFKNYRDRIDPDKEEMRLWVIRIFNDLDTQEDMPSQYKLWCKLLVTASTGLYDFFLENYKNYFKNVNSEIGLKEFVIYFIFHSLARGGDPFLEKVGVDSISKLAFGGASIFGFNQENYNRLDSYIFKMRDNNNQRNIASESKFLLFAFVTATNPPMPEFPPKMEFEFMQKMTETILGFNNLLEKENLI